MRERRIHVMPHSPPPRKRGRDGTYRVGDMRVHIFDARTESGHARYRQALARSKAEGKLVSGMDQLPQRSVRLFEAGAGKGGRPKYGLLIRFGEGVSQTR